MTGRAHSCNVIYEYLLLMHMASYLLILSELYLFFTAGKWENMVFNLYTL